ncbi:vacuolar-sorting protein BRO1-like [Typha latifolia]|uniref:vacuolar-sorting protein BRO1-like n=1 Tax=Typha latifolia TaxID=4733 RepID=UPI003C2E42F3
MASSIPMLSIPEKKTTPTILPKSVDQISDSDHDLACVLVNRRGLENPPSSLSLRRDLVVSYYNSLSLLAPHFPISLERCRIGSLSFTWHDAFGGSAATQGSIHFEVAAAAFNIAAIYSQIGAGEERGSGDGIRKACNAFQCAAGALKFLEEHVKEKVLAEGATVDLSADCVQMLEKVMLAQAQECYFERAVELQKPPGICSKVARKVGLYYEEAYEALKSPPLDRHLDKSWVSHVQLKAALFKAEACYWYSMELHGKGEIGEEIVRLKIGLSDLSKAKKVAKGVASTLIRAASRLDENMRCVLDKANRENNQIYCMRIPDASSLVEIPPASLANSTPMDKILDANKKS